MRMTLAKALKEKKRLAGRISELEQKIQANNVFSKENENCPVKFEKIDIVEDYNKYVDYHDRMAKMKSIIAQANAENGISLLVYEMEELKSHLSFLKRLNVNVKPEKEFIGDKMVFFEKEAQISYEDVTATKENIQKKIEYLQDRIDDLNATVTVEFDVVF